MYITLDFNDIECIVLRCIVKNKLTYLLTYQRSVEVNYIKKVVTGLCHTELYRLQVTFFSMRGKLFFTLTSNSNPDEVSLMPTRLAPHAKERL